MKFRVGMKVRIVKVINHQCLLGKECTITALDVEAEGRRKKYVGHALGFILPNGDEAIAHPWQLEPILPDTYQVTRWEDCEIWQPSDIREREEA